MRILNLKYIDKKNQGDCMSSPCEIFDIPCDTDNIFSPEKKFINYDIVIVGGGGLLYDVDNFCSQCMAAHAKLIIWGCGLNLSAFSVTDSLKYASLVGIRDYGTQYRHCPPPSIHHSLFDEYEDHHNTRTVGIYKHAQRVGHIENHNADVMLNNSKFEDIVKFLATSEIVITNSYHGLIWATRLGKKVICQTWSTKFLFSGIKFLSIPRYFDWRNSLDKIPEFDAIQHRNRELIEGVAFKNDAMKIINGDH